MILWKKNQRETMPEGATRQGARPRGGRACRGGCTADAKGWLKIGGGSRALVGSRGEVGDDSQV